MDRTLTFGEYLDRWLASKVRLKKSTLRSYATHVRLYLKPGLGHVRMPDLRDHHFEVLYAAMRRIGRMGEGERPSLMLSRLLSARSDKPAAQRPLSPARMRRVHATVMSALNAAVKKGESPSTLPSMSSSPPDAHRAPWRGPTPGSRNGGATAGVRAR